MKTSANVSIVNLADGRRVCLSYGVIVAAFIPRDVSLPDAYMEATRCKTLTPDACTCPPAPAGYVRTANRYSVTTSKHANQFAGKDAPQIPHDELLLLCAPIQSRE
jgi:hypothetical protein